MAFSVRDTFEGTGGTLVENHTDSGCSVHEPSGLTWAKVTGYSDRELSLSGSGGLLSAQTSDSAYRASVSAPSADEPVALSVRYRTNEGHCGLLLRCSSSAQTFYFLSIDANGGNSILVRFWRIVAGSLSQIGSSWTFTGVPDTLYVFSVIPSGSTFDIYRDGANKVTRTDSNITAAGHVGFYQGGLVQTDETTGFVIEAIEAGTSGGGGGAPTITTTTLPNATAGVAYGEQLAATGGTAPLSWSTLSGSWPNGISLTSGGLVTGTPTTPGTYNVTVRVTDSTTPTPQTDDQALVLDVDPSTLTITTTSLPAGTEGVAYSQGLNATGGAGGNNWTVSVGSLPAGLSLAASTGIISGTPTTAGTSNFTVQVEDDAAATDTQALSITINAPSSVPAPTAWWRLGEASGATAAVDSQGGYDGAYVGAVLLEEVGAKAGDPDTAALFDGLGAHVSIPHDAALTPTGDFTLALSLRTLGSTDGMAAGKVAGAGPFNGWAATAYGHDGTAQGEPCLWVGDLSAGWLEANRRIDDVAWHRVVYRLSGTTASIWIDGELANSGTRTPNVAASVPLLLGAWPHGLGWAYVGWLDEIKYWVGTALSDAEIAQDFVESGIFVAGALSVTGQGATSVDLEIDGTAGGSTPYSYQLQRAPDVSGSPGTFANVGAPQAGTTWTDSGLTGGATYWYQVVATEDGGGTATSNRVNATPGGVSGMALGLLVVRQTARSIGLELPFTGDSDASATAACRFRTTAGPGAWRDGLPLWRSNDTADLLGPGFYGSILLLEPETSYDVEVIVTRGASSQTVAATVVTLAEFAATRASIAATATHYCNATAAAGGTGTQNAPWRTLTEVRDNAPPGAVVLVDGTGDKYYQAPSSWRGDITLVGSHDQTIYNAVTGRSTPATSNRVFIYTAFTAPAGSGETAPGSHVAPWMQTSVTGPATGNSYSIWRWANAPYAGIGNVVVSTTKGGDPVRVPRWERKSTAAVDGYHLQTVGGWAEIITDTTESYDNGTFLESEGSTTVHFRHPSYSPNSRYVWLSGQGLGFSVANDGCRFIGLTFRFCNLTFGPTSNESVVAWCNFQDCGPGYSSTGTTKGARHAVGYNHIRHTKLWSDDHVNDPAIPWDDIKDGVITPSGQDYSDAVIKAETSGIRISNGAYQVMVYRNTVDGPFNGISSYTANVNRHDGGESIDVYENHFLRIADDILEPENFGTGGGPLNWRFWGNTCERFAVGLSFGPLSIGPVYVVRNTFWACTRGGAGRRGNGSTGASAQWIKWQGSVSSQGPAAIVYLLHNTFWTDPSWFYGAGANGGQKSGSGSSSAVAGVAFYSRNNVVRTDRYATPEYGDAATFPWKWNEDQNFWATSNSAADRTRGASLAGSTFTSIAAYRASSKNFTGSPNTNRLASVDYDFDRYDVVDANLAGPSVGDLRLTSGSLFRNAGTPVANVSDRASVDYEGTAPDLGAHEFGLTAATPPAAPTGLSATVISPTQIDLDWTDNASDESSTAVERSTDGGSSWAVRDTVGPNVEAYSDTGLTPGTTYHYRVRAQNAGGSSAYSNTASGTATSVTPAAPTALSATAASSTLITLAWTDNATDESGTLVERSLDGTNWATVATLAPNTQTYDDDTVDAGETYYYRVRAYRLFGADTYYSAYSNTDSDTTPAATNPPAAPTGLSAVATAPDSVVLTWTDNATDETGFSIERSPNGSTGWTEIDTVADDVTTYEDTTVAADTAYWYRVRAHRSTDSVYSAYSNVASVITPEEPAPELPSGLRVLVDWDDDGDYEDVGEDVSADVLLYADPITMVRGRDQLRQLAPPMAGSFTCSVDNQDRTYAPQSPGSPLASYLFPGHSVRCEYLHEGVPYPLWTGILDDLPQHPQIGRERADLPAFGTLTRLRGKTVTTALATNVRTDEALSLLLDAAGWPADQRVLNAGATTLDYWWLDEQDAFTAAQELVNTEGPGAALYEDAEGRLVFEGRHYRITNPRCTTAQATFLGDGSEPHRLPDLAYNPGLKDVFTRCAVEVKLRATQPLDVLWQLGEDVTLAANQTKGYTIRSLSGDPFTGALVPVAGTDYTVTVGSLSSVSLTHTSGGATTLFLTAGASGATVTGLQVRAQVVAVTNTVVVTDTVTAETQTARDRYGTITYPLSVRAELDVEVARDFCNAIVQRYRAPRATVEFTIPAITDASTVQALTRQVSDRIGLADPISGLALQVFVERLSSRMEGAILLTTIGGEEASDTSEYGVYGTGQYDVSRYGF